MNSTQLAGTLKKKKVYYCNTETLHLSQLMNVKSLEVKK